MAKLGDRKTDVRIDYFEVHMLTTVMRRKDSVSKKVSGQFFVRKLKLSF
jgi:hypothetical protein